MLLKLSFLLTFLIALVSPLRCYRCASEYPLIHWVRFNLPLFQGSEQQADKTCMDDRLVSTDIDCKGVGGLCVTINLNLVESNRSLGVVRECHRLKAADKLALMKSPCIIEEQYTPGKKAHRKKVFVEYCYCNDNYCNGHQHHRPQRRGGLVYTPISSSGDNALFLWSIGIISCFSSFIWRFL